MVPTDEQRFRELDGLRGIAAIAVVSIHFTFNFNIAYPDVGKVPFEFPWGSYGVQLFFLISGYVILMTAQRSRRITDFVISRVSRLYPTYWIAVTASILITLAFPVPGIGVSWIDRILNYTMVQRLLLVPNVDIVYWTLAIEMQFYALIALLLFFSRNRLTNFHAMGFAAAWCAVALLASLYVYPDAHGVNPQEVATRAKIILNLGIVEWAPLFSCGMASYIARSSDSRYIFLAFIFGVQATMEAFILHDLDSAFIVAGVVGCFLLVIMRKRTGILLAAPLQFYGKISYSLYIQHYIPGLLIIRYFYPILGPVPSLLIAFAAVTFAAYLLHLVGERWASKKFRNFLLELRSHFDIVKGAK
ncbi:acyltransferase family protein [Dermabacteraceae bacterium P7006]